MSKINFLCHSKSGDKAYLGLQELQRSQRRLVNLKINRETINLAGRSDINTSDEHRYK